MRKLAALIAVLLVSACGAEQETPSTPAQEPQPSKENAKLEISAGRVTLIAEGVARSALLQQLAEAAGFRLEQASADWQPVDLRLQDVSLGEALDRLLEGMPYGVEYAVAPALGEHVVASVRVGKTDTAPAVQPAPPADRVTRVPSPRREARVPARPPSERQSEPIDDEVRESLESADPELRIEGLSAVGPEGEGFRVLVETLGHDPDPGVRGAAAEELGYAGTFGAIEALLVALDDPDPEVVIQVVEALESTADETLIPHLEPYLEHRDPAVREAVEAAIGYLE